MRLVPVLAVLLLAACGTPYDDDLPVARAAVTGPGTVASVPAPAATRGLLFRDAGPGTQQTQRFTVTSDAQVRYTVTCANGVGLFVMDAISSDGAPVGLANTQELRVDTDSYINEPGSYYLSINTVCPWTVEVYG